MSIKHIQDQVENVGMDIAREAFILGMKEAQKVYNDEQQFSSDDVNDALSDIVKNKIEGK